MQFFTYSVPVCLLRVERQTSEIERLELMIAETKTSIEKYKGQGVSTDTQRKKILRGLEEQLSITEVSPGLMSNTTDHKILAQITLFFKKKRVLLCLYRVYPPCYTEKTDAYDSA